MSNFVTRFRAVNKRGNYWPLLATVFVFFLILGIGMLLIALPAGVQFLLVLAAAVIGTVLCALWVANR